MIHKKPLRELNFFYMMAFVFTGILYFVSLQFCQALQADLPVTALVTTMFAQFAPAVAVMLTGLRFGFNKKQKETKNFHPSLLLVIIVPIFAVGSQYLLHMLNQVAPIESMFFTSVGPSLIALVTTILGSVAEELAWRAYLFARLQIFLNRWQRSALTGVLWGLWHFTKIFQRGFGAYLLFTLSLVPLSILMCYVNEKAGSILPSIIIHTLFNLFSMRFLFERESSAGYLICSLTLCVILLGVRLFDPSYFKQQRETTATLGV